MNPAFDFELLAPWVAVPDDASPLVAELHRELRTDHPLHGIQARAVARRWDCDDVLFQIDGRAEQYADVHLTGSGRVDPNQGWPHTELYLDAPDWRVRCMIPDHEDYTA